VGTMSAASCVYILMYASKIVMFNAGICAPKKAAALSLRSSPTLKPFPSGASIANRRTILAA
jgi:hypothetical protein